MARCIGAHSVVGAVDVDVKVAVVAVDGHIPMVLKVVVQVPCRFPPEVFVVRCR